MGFSESRIFKNEEILSPEHLPELLPHREQQTQQLAKNLEPAAKGRRAQNTFLFGSPGIGKTASTKFVFRQFEQEYPTIKTIYINCWDYKTANAVLGKIAEELKAFTFRRGVGKDEILEKIVENCKKMKKGLIICLDEVDQLIFNEQEVLYDLLRINQYIENPVGIVFISNNPHVFVNIEPRIKSSLNIEEIEFRAYNIEEMKDILQERVKLAFISFEPAIVLLAANHAVMNGGDVRIGLECLMKAGRVAEQESNKVKVGHMKRILSSVKPVKPEILKERINEDERVILEIVNEYKTLNSGELYEIYSKKIEVPVSDRRFRDFVNHLADISLVKVRERKRGALGKTRMISRA